MVLKSLESYFGDSDEFSFREDALIYETNLQRRSAIGITEAPETALNQEPPIVSKEVSYGLIGTYVMDRLQNYLLGL